MSELKVFKVGELFEGFFPTGFNGLDVAIGGGFPVGKMVELFGDESSGKTAFALQMVDSYLSDNEGEVLYVDSEQALGVARIKELVSLENLDRLVLSQVNTVEGLSELIKSSPNYGMVVVDSIAGLSVEIDNDYHGNSNMGKFAQSLGKYFRVVMPIFNKNKTIVININQMRQSIANFYGASWYTAGGKAVKYTHSVRLKISGAKKYTNGFRAMKFNVYKNRYGVDGVDIPMYYGGGKYSVLQSHLDYLIDKGVIRVSGSTYIYDGRKIAISRTKALIALQELLNDTTLKDIR